MTASRDPIAIIGSSCRFAGGASSPSKLWDLLLNPRDISAPPPSTRFNLDGFHDHNPERHGHTNVCGSYFLTDDPCAFDSVFFNISPKEAEAIDPQQRLLLELAYEAIESAGQTLQGLRGSDTSVYVGLMIRDYLDVQTRDPDYFSKYMVTGTSSALNANRISYFFDWHGPSLTVDTACSSSLVAVHQAIQGLRCDESRVALVAGTNLLLGPELFISASNMRMLSSRSRMWDAGAEGYARGDGLAVFLLKTLPNAIADGDSIEAIIRETGVNSDGHTQGITLPSSVAQAALIRETYRRAGLDISQAEGRPQYIEAHGTGTQAGDPLEASAIHQAFFGEDLAIEPASPRIWTGSIKTVIGHTEGAAGMAGMLKALLSMKHRKIPPNLHFHEPSSSVAHFQARLPIPTEPVPWPKLPPGTPLRVSVNSFGFGGTNAHAILESYEPEATATQPLQHHNGFAAPLVLSAHSETALQSLVKGYSASLKSHDDPVRLRDLAYTLRSRRSTLPFRAFFSGVTTSEIAKDMDQRLLSGKDIGHRSPDSESKLCILGIFTGQGAQWPTMGKHLIESSRIFGETIDRLETVLTSLPDGPGWSLREEILAPESKSRLSQAALSQPLCTAIAIALVDLLRASGVTFNAVVGHSSGEIGAAYAAGVIDSSEAMKIAYYRGVHAHHAGTNYDCGERGGMIAVGMGLQAAKDFCSLPQFVGRLAIAASNSASSVTLSGDMGAIKEAKGLFDSQNMFARVLQVDTAYHSHYMDPCAEPYMASLTTCDIQAQNPEVLDCAWISSVYGSEGVPTVEELRSTYWKDNMIKPVLFSQATERALIEHGPFDAAIEVGPAPALKGPVSQTIRDVSDISIPYIATLDRRKNDVVSFGEALASLWLHFGPGAVDFEGHITASEPLGVDPPALVKDDLPSYPWDHSQAFWRESRLSREYRLRGPASNELLGHFVPGGNSQRALRWRNILRPNEVPWIGCHRFEGTATLPTSAFCLMAIEAGMELASVAKIGFETGTIEVQSLEIFGLVTVPDGSDGVELSTSIQRVDIHSHDSCFVADFLVLHGSPDGTTPLMKAASARIALSPDTTEVVHHDCRKSDFSDDRMEDFEAAELFDTLSQTGLEYTGPFRSLQNVRCKWRHSNALFCDPLSSTSNSWVVNPFFIEGCIQTAHAAFATPGGTSLWSSFLPSRIQRLSINLSSLSRSASRLEVDGRIVEATHVTSRHGASFHAEVEVLDESGDVCMEFEGLEISSRGPASPEDDREIFFQTVWERNIEIDDGIQTTCSIQTCSDFSILDGRRLLVIGGKTSPTKEAIQSIGLLLGSRSPELVIVDSFEDLRLEEHWDLAGAIILADLDCPLVDSLTPRAYDSICQIFRQLSSILWVTSGSLTCSPGQAVSTGLVQALSAQFPFVNTQLLDVDTLKGSEKQIVSSFLRLLISSLPDSGNTNRLGIVERQIAIRDGHECVSRVRPIRDMNDRLNSQRRVITRQVSKRTPMSITLRGSIDSASYHVDSIGPDDGNLINVSFSLPFAVKVSRDTFVYLFAGNNQAGESHIGCSKDLTLPSRPSAVWKVPEGIQISDARLLELCSSLAVARSIFDLLPSGRSVILEPGQLLASLISDLAKDTDRDVSFITTTSRDPVDDAWISIPAHASKRAIRSALPPDIKVLFVVPNCSDRSLSRIQQSLSSDVSVYDSSAIFSLKARTSEKMAAESLGLIMRNLGQFALELSKRIQMLQDFSLPRINPDQLLDGSPQSHPGPSIVEWKKMTTVVAIIEGRKPNAILFPHKVYLLVQLQPQLLQSISHWLASCGVRKLIIVDTLSTSWRGLELVPNVSVSVIQADLTELSEVRQLMDGIPDVGGVIYGGSHAQLSIKYERRDFSRTWRDMISSSRNLTETLLAKPPDFFIMLSSDEENSPSSPYLACLALQARSRGLSASFVDLATSWRSRSISESDMHYILTEAIYASHLGSHDPLIIAGLKPPRDQADLDASACWDWLRQPGLAHRPVSLRSSKGPSGGTGRPKSLRERLDTCHDYEMASAAIWEFLRPQLARLLNLVLDNIKPGDDLVSLGVDSLSASDLRAWFLGEIGEDIPMFKILGSSTIAQLCDEAAATLSLDIMGAGMISTSKGSVTISSSPGAGTPLNSDDLYEAVGTTYHSKLQRPEPQSLNQTRLWFPSTYLDQKTPFNCTTAYSLSGRVDASRLDTAFRLLIQRHQSFRTSFFNDETTGEPMQRILESSPFMLKVMLGNRDEDYQREFRRVQAYHFDLAVADTFIATLISHGDGEHTIITGYHHIIMDGVSWQITLRDLAMFYQSETPELPPSAQYVDFATRQRQLISNDHHRQKLEFWRNEFPVVPDVMPLFPFAKVSTRKTLTQYSTIDVVLDVEASLVARIKKASLKAKSTSFHFYLSAFVVLVNRCLEMDEICLGVIDANRSDKTFLNTIGFMLDMLPLKLKVNKRERFLHTLQCTRKKAYSVLENSGVPLDAIIKELQIPASSTHTPMFQILINYRMGALRAPDIGEAKMNFLAYEDAKAPFDMTLSIDEKDDGTGMLTFSMHDYMYDRKGAELLASTYVHLLEALSHDPSQRLNSVCLSSQGASSKALAIGTGPVVDFGWSRTQTISHRVDHQARQHPDRLAVKDLKGWGRTYLETFKRVNALAQALIQSGITHGSRVAVFCEPSVDIVACILASHRVGATYIPLDVRNSPERLRATVEECDPALILYDPNTKDCVFDFVPAGKPTLDISTIPESTDLIVPNVSRLSDDAFILYTSGSTGRPKGIALTQASLSIHCASISGKLGLCHRDVFLQQSALGFDAALGQMLYALTNGGALILGNNRDDPRDLALLMEREKVTFTLFIVSEVLALLQHGSDVLSRCSSWRTALCGGEAFTGRLLSRFRALGLPNLVLYNAYGPTEGSIICSIGTVPYHDETFGEDATIPCGPPLANYGVYVLDDQLRPVPVGWPGELCISGPCVASRYVGQPVLTAAKFKVDHLRGPNGAYDGWTTIYRTGDRARMLDDGSFIFLGRINGDSQVKLRGIRIELGEVTGAIIKASKGAIVDAVTIVSGSTAQALVSFVVFSRACQKISDQEWLHRDFLRKLVQNLPLPVYMRPAVAIPLDHLPVTARGKLDIQALAAYQPDEEADEDAEPLTETEQKLKDVWQKTLPEHGLGCAMCKTSDFFSVGGNSLLLIRLRAAIRDAFGVDIPLVDLFQASTLEALAAHLDSSRSLPVEIIDWEEETTLDACLPRAKNIRSLASDDAEPIEVVLTGSTGLLGSEIVRQLLAHPMVSRIHCVAVRPGRILPSSDKITVHTGDLALPFLGLGEDEARGIFSRASAILHNGAEVSHMKTYQSLRSANVGSTEQLIALALSTAHEVGAPVPSFHFISSAGVGGLVGASEFPEMSVSAYPPAAEGASGYIAAKYASEVLLERASQLGLPVTIHRPSNISGVGVQDRDIVHSIWRWAERMRAVPDLVAAGAVGAFDFVGVESCAGGIIRSMFQGLRGGHALRYVHQSGDRVIPIAAFAKAMEDKMGMEVEVLPFEEWIGRVVEMGGDELVVSFLKQIGGALVMPLLRRGDDVQRQTDERP